MQEPLSSATAIVIFDNTNIAAVDDGGLSPTFAITRPHLITSIHDYHWNGGRGANPGTISLRRHDGSIFGPWQVTASSGQGGAPNVNWDSSPNVTIPAGTYTVVDSDLATWSQNAQTARAGFSTVKGHPDQ